LSWRPDDLLQWFYGGYDGIEPAAWCEFYEHRMVATPQNTSAAELNAHMLQGLPSGKQRTSLSHDEAMADGDAGHYTPEFLNSLEPNGMPPHELKTCPGALMIILRNYAPWKGLCNGTRVVVRGQWRRLLQVQVVTGPARGNIELLPRIVCDSTGDNELPFVLRRLQFPLRPAWAISINKAQGQTVRGRTGIYLPTPAFAHGQLYVAASRATLASNVRVLVENDDEKQRKVQRGGLAGDVAVYTLNLVDQTLLHDAPPEQSSEPNGVQNPVAHPKAISAQVQPWERVEQHRLASILPEPLVTRSSGLNLSWGSTPTSTPLSADEWAVAESGAPCQTHGSFPPSLQELLEERSPAQAPMEYVRDGEAEGDPCVSIAAASSDSAAQ